jgi:hypothetical protein
MPLPDPSDHWFEIGQNVANSVIDNAETADTVKAILFDADRSWDDDAEHTADNVNLMAGFRDTLREHLERGNG